ncbi:MAG: peptide/nickel transport system substrate-binding protein [Gammaproteobacteria bacterium]|jgi:peptide/nickel transport system substrate-binding protein
MKYFTSKIAVAALVGASMGLAGPAIAQTPKSGGVLNLVVPSNPPSYDAHRETTFGVIHPLAPMYSLLIRVDPEDPQSSKFVCDLCVGDVPEPTDGGVKYTFKIRDGVKFHDGTPLTAVDIKASFDKIIQLPSFPHKGVPSSRKAFFVMVKSIEAPDASTFVITTKYPSGAFIGSLGMPFNWIYSKKDLDAHGMDWHTKNINGSGPFKFAEHVAGSHISGVKNDNYHHKGQPYLDGYKAIIAPKMALRLQAIMGDRAAIEFRGFPPAARDDLVKNLGDKITVQESNWNCGNIIVYNHIKKPFDDPRVRRALNLAVDRWKGSEYLSKIAIVKTVGGVVFPGHPLARTDAELQEIEGFWTDIKKSRELAKKLLKEAGHENLKFDLHNRAVDQPYKFVGTWLIDQWRQIGIKATQKAVPTALWYSKYRKTKDYDVGVDANCQAVINPIIDIGKYLCGASSNYNNCSNPKLNDLFQTMNREGDIVKQKTLMNAFESEIYDNAHVGNGLWWYKINPHRSYVKGWKIAPSHYLNQQLDNVWLDK